MPRSVWWQQRVVQHGKPVRVATVEMDNFAQELSAKIEAEYLQEVPVNARGPSGAQAKFP